MKSEKRRSYRLVPFSYELNKSVRGTSRYDVRISHFAAGVQTSRQSIKTYVEGGRGRGGGDVVARIFHCAQVVVDLFVVDARAVARVLTDVVGRGGGEAEHAGLYSKLPVTLTRDACDLTNDPMAPGMPILYL